MAKNGYVKIVLFSSRQADPPCRFSWTIFSTGQEVISDQTGATMQSFQTRLRTGPMGFDIITHVSRRGNRCFSFNLVNHFALVPIEQAP